MTVLDSVSSALLTQVLSSFCQPLRIIVLAPFPFLWWVFLLTSVGSQISEDWHVFTIGIKTQFYNFLWKGSSGWKAPRTPFTLRTPFKGNLVQLWMQNLAHHPNSGGARRWRWHPGALGQREGHLGRLASCMDIVHEISYSGTANNASWVQQQPHGNKNALSLDNHPQFCKWRRFTHTHMYFLTVCSLSSLAMRLTKALPRTRTYVKPVFCCISCW